MLIAAWRMQERIVWQPPRLAQYPSADSRRLDYASDDGQSLFAFLVGNLERAPGLLITYHCNADLAAWVAPWEREVERSTGWAVLVPEYRGYAGLSGAPGLLSSQRDVRASDRRVREHLGVDSARIAIFGHSQLRMIGTLLAIEHAPAPLILEAIFT